MSLFTNAEEKSPQKKFIESYPAKVGTFAYDAETLTRSVLGSRGWKFEYSYPFTGIYRIPKKSTCVRRGVLICNTS
jgi:hypothetical protein